MTRTICFRAHQTLEGVKFYLKDKQESFKFKLVATLAAITVRLTRIEVNLHNLTARKASNQLVRDRQHRINAIWLCDGTTPPGVPAASASRPRSQIATA